MMSKSNSQNQIIVSYLTVPLSNKPSNWLLFNYYSYANIKWTRACVANAMPITTIQ